ncbi:unnamed protein product, partial [Gongylonema pulchrum]|uniref:Protein patched n=1 Tax=Gongylonema pulchrum TaxID=637853 RepID=A0A183EN65_9BILA
MSYYQFFTPVNERHYKGLVFLRAGFEQRSALSRNWTLSDICFKPPSPQLPQGPLTSLLTKLLERLIPCIWITPIDCFWEGSKPLGPSPPLNFGPDAQAFISSLPKGNITWRNLDPSAVLKE